MQYPMLLSSKSLDLSVERQLPSTMSFSVDDRRRRGERRPLFTSPRCQVEDDQLFPAPVLLQEPTERWKFLSKQAGAHQQDLTRLRINRNRYSPRALSGGVPPAVASRILELYVEGHDDLSLPEWLDVIVPKFERLQHLTFETTDIDNKMRRLYILYRLPDLVSIDGTLVTEQERRLARPDDPNGHRVNRDEWITKDSLLDEEDDSSTSTSTSCDSSSRESNEQVEQEESSSSQQDEHDNTPSAVRCTSLDRAECKTAEPQTEQVRSKLNAKQMERRVSNPLRDDELEYTTVASSHQEWSAACGGLSLYFREENRFKSLNPCTRRLRLSFGRRRKASVDEEPEEIPLKDPESRLDADGPKPLQAAHSNLARKAPIAAHDACRQDPPSPPKGLPETPRVRRESSLEMPFLAVETAQCNHGETTKGSPKPVNPGHGTRDDARRVESSPEGVAALAAPPPPQPTRPESVSTTAVSSSHVDAARPTSLTVPLSTNSSQTPAIMTTPTRTSTNKAIPSSMSLSSPFPMQFRVRTTPCNKTPKQQEPIVESEPLSPMRKTASFDPDEPIGSSVSLTRTQSSPPVMKRSSGLPPPCPGARRFVPPIQRRRRMSWRAQKQSARSSSIFQVDDDDEEDESFDNGIIYEEDEE